MAAPVPRVSEVEARFSKLRRSLDEAGYLESFGSDSLRLVEHLYNDLVETTGSLQKTLEEYAHYKKIDEELENGVLPFKEENVRLRKENSQLRIGIARAYEDAEDKARDPLSRLRDLEEENNDLKLLVSKFAERVKKLETESLEKTQRIIKLQLHEQELTPTVSTGSFGVLLMHRSEKVKRAMAKHQTMEIDYFVPEACPQCIRLKNYVKYGKHSDRSPKTVDYIKLADSRIEALQLQLRSLKNMEKEHVSMITSLKNRIDTRDSEIGKLRDLIKVKAGSENLRDGKEDRNFAIELKSSEMKLQVLQLRNMELEEKLKKSIFQEHESYMLGKIPAQFGDRNVASIFLEKELDKYPSHGKMTLLEKLYYLEQQLSHCCKEKAILQRKIDECRLKHPPATVTHFGKGNAIQISQDTEIGGAIPDRESVQVEKLSFGGKQATRKPVMDKSRPAQNKIVTKHVAGGRIGSQISSPNKAESRKYIPGRTGNVISQHGTVVSSKPLSDKSAVRESRSGLVPERERETVVGSSDIEEMEFEGSGSDCMDNDSEEATKYRGSAVIHEKDEKKERTNVARQSRSTKTSSKQVLGEYSRYSNKNLKPNTNVKKMVASKGPHTSVSGDGKGKDKAHKYVRISNEAQNASAQPTNGHIETDEYSSVDFNSSDEDGNANGHVETFDKNANGSNAQKTGHKLHESKSNRLTSNAAETKTNQKPKSRSPNNARVAGIKPQSQGEKRSYPIRASGSKENVTEKSKSTLGERVAVSDSKDRYKGRQFQETQQRDKNAKVKGTISNRGKGKISSSVITTATRVEDFEAASHGVSDEEEYFDEDVGNEDQEQQYDEEEYEEEKLSNQKQDSNLLQSDVDGLQQQRDTQRRRRDKQASKETSNRNRYARHETSEDKPAPDKQRSSKANMRGSQMRHELTRGGPRATPASSKDTRSIKRNFVSTDGRTNVSVENEEIENESNGSVASYCDDDDDEFANDVAEQEQRPLVDEPYQRDNLRHGRHSEPNGNTIFPSSQKAIAKGSKSDSRLPQTTSGPGSSSGPTGHSSSSRGRDFHSGTSQGILAVQEPSLLSISEFEKENSDHEMSSQAGTSKQRLQPPGKRILQDSGHARYDPQSQPRRNIDQELHDQRRPPPFRTRGEGDQYEPYMNPHEDNAEKIPRPRGGGRQMTDVELEYGRGRTVDGGDAGTIYGTASDSSQSRRAMRDVPQIPMHRRGTSQLSQERSIDDGRTSGLNVRDRFAERSYPLRSIGVNTEETRQFGFPVDTRSDDSQERRQLLDKVAALQRKLDELHTESSRHQLKSFELQGEMERTKHMLQIEKQERELATAELRRAQDRNSEASARLLMNSSLGSDPLRRGATPMEMEREVGNLRAALASLDRDKDEMRVELDRKDEKLARVLEESSQYMDEISQLKLRLKNADLQISHTGESAKEQIREVDFLKKQLENTRRDLEKIIRERDEAQKELHKISGAHAKGQMERRSVVSELELKSKEAEDLRKQVQRYIDEVRRIEELLLDKEEEMDTLIQHYRALTVENSNLEVQRTHLEQEASSIRESVKDAVDQNIGFKTQLASQNSLVQSLEDEIQRFTQQISQLENQLGSKTEKEDMLTQDLKASKDLLYRLEVQMDKLKLDLADSESKRKQNEVENAELAAHVASLESRLQEEIDKQQQLETLVANSREKDFQQERSTLNISRERNELAENLTSLQQRSESLNSEVSRYRLKSIELQNELDRTRRQLDNEKRDRESAISELRRAREQLHSSSANYLLKSALGSSGLQSETQSPASGSASNRQTLLGGGAHAEGFQRSSREQSPYTAPQTTSDLQMETPPNATSTSRFEEKPEDPPAPYAASAGDARTGSWDSPN